MVRSTAQVHRAAEVRGLREEPQHVPHRGLGAPGTRPAIPPALTLEFRRRLLRPTKICTHSNFRKLRNLVIFLQFLVSFLENFVRLYFQPFASNSTGGRTGAPPVFKKDKRKKNKQSAAFCVFWIKSYRRARRRACFARWMRSWLDNWLETWPHWLQWSHWCSLRSSAHLFVLRLFFRDSSTSLKHSAD